MSTTIPDHPLQARRQEQVFERAHFVNPDQWVGASWIFVRVSEEADQPRLVLKDLATEKIVKMLFTLFSVK